MPRMWTLLRAAAVVVGGSAALLAGGIAHADPVPAVPAIPNIADQLINTAANAPQMLQSLATALGAKPPLPATPPLASAALQMPQLPSAANVPGAASAVPGANSLLPAMSSLLPGATTGTPATVPGAGPAATGPARLLPSAKLDLPQSPLLPVPLPQQVSLPGDLTSLATGGVPATHGIQPGAGALPAPPAPAAASNPLMAPLLSALP